MGIHNIPTSATLQPPILSEIPINPIMYVIAFSNNVLKQFVEFSLYILVHCEIVVFWRIIVPKIPLYTSPKYPLQFYSITHSHRNVILWSDIREGAESLLPKRELDVGGELNESLGSKPTGKFEVLGNNRYTECT